MTPEVPVDLWLLWKPVALVAFLILATMALAVMTLGLVATGIAPWRAWSKQGMPSRADGERSS
jgi:hypothetical protein